MDQSQNCNSYLRFQARGRRLSLHARRSRRRWRIRRPTNLLTAVREADKHMLAHTAALRDNRSTVIRLLNWDEWRCNIVTKQTDLSASLCTIKRSFVRATHRFVGPHRRKIRDLRMKLYGTRRTYRLSPLDMVQSMGLWKATDVSETEMCDVHPSHYSWFWSGVGFYMEKGQMKLGARSRVLLVSITFHDQVPFPYFITCTWM